MVFPSIFVKNKQIPVANLRLFTSPSSLFPEDYFYRHFVKAEIFADLINEITLVRKMDAFDIAHKENKSRRFDVSLGCIIDVLLTALKTGQRSALYRSLHQCIQRRRSHSLGVLRINLFNEAENFRGPLSCYCGDENYRGKVHELQLVFNIFDKFADGGIILFNLIHLLTTIMQALPRS